ncbi:RNA N6-adenosine-methyltransferase mettl16-like [Strongylocentrotus purpuratus]|uniref:RNA N(6)-adenosine-methyltransferase METTL16 n=1 Tax=Strongylocentrotus purpuratus TaxID=7668 RepID=A0A7M7P904_STRPU|nr:RNA N6-adenosine-methyltransferase mettl16-like [Strongylocentrotus purpuratus]
MAFNKFMHPRNRYKDNKPNFDELAEKYPEFARHVIRNQAGKATLDFHDSESLRSLTCTLLKEDFGLEVELPLDRLIPTLSLRLNYIHWIEDLLASTGHGKETVWGIDTGCGASCIYPLLGAQMNGWNFLASEVDALAIYYAKENITRNGLDDKITVVETLEDSMFEQALNSAPSRQPLYHFTMCNPPFFGNSLEAQGIMTSRSMSRPEPKSVSTAAELEMISEGGEVEFVRRMIEESLHLKNQVVWYTSMLGKKSSLALVREELRKHKIRNVTHTEFCQGRTMRWGIAWTFKEDMESPLLACPKRKLAEKNVPFTVTVPDTYIKRVLEPGLSGGLQNRIQSVAKAVHTMMQGLEMSVNRKPSSKWCPKFVLTASRNTWSYQRRKRRREKLIQRKSSVCPKATAQTPSPGESSSLSSSSLAAVPSSSKVVAGEERLGQDAPSRKDTFPSSSASSSFKEDERIQRATSGLLGVVPSSSSSPRASTTATSEDGRILKKARLDTSYPPGDPSTSTATRSEKLPTPAPTLSTNISKASCKTTLESTCSLHENTFATASHDSAVGRLGDKIEVPASSQGKTDLADNIVSRQPTEAGQTMTDVTRYKDQSSSSSDEADDGFPLDINLDIKLCDRRTIVFVASVADSSKKNLLYQVVQYIKNQMK